MLLRIAEAAIGYGLVYFFDGPTWASVMTAFLCIQMPIITPFTPETEQLSQPNDSHRIPVAKSFYREPVADTPERSVSDSMHRHLEERLRNGLASIVGRPFPSTIIDYSIVVVSLV